MLKIALLACFLCFGYALPVRADIDVQAMARAIKRAENSYMHPYGILKSYCKAGDPNGQCKKGAIQTINKWKYKLAHETDAEWINAFSKIYAPINCDTDNGTNKYWSKNVRIFYEQEIKSLNLTKIKR